MPELSRRGGFRRAIRLCTLSEAESELERADRAGAELLFMTEARYPTPLAALDAPPPLLYAKGRLGPAQPADGRHRRLAPMLGSRSQACPPLRDRARPRGLRRRLGARPRHRQRRARLRARARHGRCARRRHRCRLSTRARGPAGGNRRAWLPAHRDAHRLRGREARISRAATASSPACRWAC